MKTALFLRWVCLITVIVGQTSCVDGQAKREFRAQENRNNLALLQPDMTPGQVTATMGPPDKIVPQHGKNNESVLTYLYITVYFETYTSRGWDKNNYTPVIFVNDRLSGWGWHHLDLVAQQYGFDITRTPFLAPPP